MSSKLKKVTIVTAIIFLLGGIWFYHSTPERAVRIYAMLHEDFIKGIRTEIYKGPVDQTYGQLYYSRNPEVMFRWSYAVNQGLFGMWFVNVAGTGRG